MAIIINTKIDYQKILSLISNHNSFITSLKSLDTKVSANNFFPAMQLWSYIAFEGNDIVTLARSVGINVKGNMQDGEITFYNQEFLHEVKFENGECICVKSGEEKLSIDVATAHLRFDIEKNGKIVEVTPITQKEARMFYNFNGYEYWPLIG